MQQCTHVTTCDSVHEHYDVSEEILQGTVKSLLQCKWYHCAVCSSTHINTCDSVHERYEVTDEFTQGLSKVFFNVSLAFHCALLLTHHTRGMFVLFCFFLWSVYTPLQNIDMRLLFFFVWQWYMTLLSLRSHKWNLFARLYHSHSMIIWYILPYVLWVFCLWYGCKCVCACICACMCRCERVLQVCESFACLLHRALHAPMLPVDFQWGTVADFAIVCVRVQKNFAFVAGVWVCVCCSICLLN